MRLKKLEIKGFKSFARPTEVLFSKNITGIVGPNGSGKSNVVDAFRWVLGEQKSRELRLEKMEDVLFNGTKKRKKAKVAQVSLVFENNMGVLPSEYSEVNISRILYASGNSEYRLNDVSCRLKDIKSLLANTGIGSNSYAIIQLGMMNDILDNRNNSRKRMFEQAAGIFQFKEKKHQTELKLKATAEDLDRVEDLLHEIEGQLKQLEKQARRAKKFLRMKEQYKEESLILGASSLAEYKSTYEDLKKSVMELKEQENASATALHQKTAGIEALKAEVVQKEEELTKRRKQAVQLKSEIADEEHQIKLLQQEMKFAEDSLKQDDGNLKFNEEKATLLQHDLTKDQDALNIAKQRLATEEEAMAEAERAKKQIEERLLMLRADQDGLKALQLEINNRVTQHQQETIRFSSRLESLQQMLQAIFEQQAQRKEKHAEVQQSMQSAAQASDQAKVSLDQQEEKIARSEQQKRIIGEQITKITEEVNDNNRQLDAKQNEYNLLKNMIDNLEGYPESIKFLEHEKNWSATKVLLSDIISCPDEYRSVIEMYLEPYLNFYVVKSIHEVESAIALLSKGQRGKASFFVMDEIELATDSLLNKTIGTAALDVIQVDPMYQRLFHYLLHDVYLVQTEEEFRSLVKMGLNGVLMNGQILRRNNVLNGGSIGLFEGKKIGRKQSLTKLQKEMDGLKKQVQEKLKQKEELQKKNDEIDIDAQRLSLRQNELQYNQLMQALRQQEFALDQIQDQEAKDVQRAAELSEEIKSMESNIARIKTELVKDQQVLEGMMNKTEAGESQMFGIDEELNQAVAHFNACNIKYVQVKNELDGLENQIQIRANQLKDLQEVQAKQLEQKENWTKKIVDNSAAIKSIKDRLADHHVSFSSYNEELNAFEESYFKAKNSLFENEKELNQLDKALRAYQQKLADEKDAYNEVRMKITEISQRVQVEFDMSTVEMLKLEVPEDVNIEKLRAQVEKLRFKIANYGDINPLALENHREMEARYNRILEQKNDILDAKKDLLKTIQTLDERATTQFLTAFDQIRENFKEIFRTLFEEDDDCDIVLIDPDNPLDSDIEVKAKPKGKRPKTLRQLSGGEQTLTATALLFSLYLLKPAPLCIFDEVDAPLDDKNIEKFNRLIEKFSGNSQFIIITHNKLTMASVDVIYGIYMDEPGVSNLAVVDFSSLKHEPAEFVFSQN